MFKNDISIHSPKIAENRPLNDYQGTHEMKSLRIFGGSEIIISVDFINKYKWILKLMSFFTSLTNYNKR